jgi:hypothetical protein
MRAGATILIAAALLLVVGCGEFDGTAGSPSSAPIPSGPAAAVPTKSFSNAALGVSFRDPAAWHVSHLLAPLDAPTKNGDVEVKGPRVLVSVTVGIPQRPLDSRTFLSANRNVMKALEVHPGRTGFMHVDGYRFAFIEGTARGWRVLRLGGEPAGIDLTGRRSAWVRLRPQFMAVLASMRFSKPQGAK